MPADLYDRALLALHDHDAPRCGHRCTDTDYACTRKHGHAGLCAVVHEPEEPWTHLRAAVNTAETTHVLLDAARDKHRRARVVVLDLARRYPDDEAVRALMAIFGVRDEEVRGG